MPGRPKPGGDRGTQTGVSCSNSEEQGAWLIGQRKPVTTEKLPPLPPAHCRRLELGSIRGRATVRAMVRVMVRMKGRTRGWAEGRNMVEATERVKVRTTVKAMRQGKLGKGRSGLTAAVQPGLWSGIPFTTYSPTCLQSCFFPRNPN